jgi:hypothetical protein
MTSANHSRARPSSASVVQRALIALLTAAFLGVSGLTLSACGGSDNTPASKAFGKLSSQDMSKLRQFSSRSRTVVSAQAQMIGAMNDKDVTVAREQLDGLERTVEVLRQSTVDFDSATLRRVLGDYVRPLQRYALAVDRLISAVEDEEDAGMSTSDAAANDMIADVQDAAEAARAADEKLMNRLLDVMSPEQRSEYRKLYQQVQQRFEQQTGR